MSDAPLLQLLILDDDLSTQTHIYDTPRITLGKDPSNILCLDSTYLSRFHGVFVNREGGWYYQDAKSTNGTQVLLDGRSEMVGGPGVAEVPLRGGEALQIGHSLRIAVRLLDSAGDQDDYVVRAVCDAAEALKVIPQGDELRLLFQTVRAVSRCSSDEEVLEVIAQAALEAMPAITHVLFVDREAPGEGWEVRWARQRSGARHGEMPGVSQTLLDEAVDRGVSQLYSTLTPPTQVSHSMISEQISSSVCVPLRGLEGHLGVVQGDCRGNAASLRERDLHLLTLLAEQAAVMIDRLRITQSIQRMFEGVVNASVKAIESRDPTTAGHSARVADFSLRVAGHIDSLETGPLAHVRFGESELRTLRYAALLHDFGKIAVPTELLLKARKLLNPTITEIQGRFRLAKMEVRARCAEAKVKALLEDPADTGALAALDAEAAAQTRWLETELKWLMGAMEPGVLAEPEAPRLRALTREWHSAGVRLLEPEELAAMIGCGRGTLTVEERLKVQEHASWTRCYLEEIPWSEDLVCVPDFAGDHHEKLNGRGYPRGVPAREIPVQVRILTVCDIYDALTDRDRPYRTAMTPQRALGILEKEVQDGAVDPHVLGALQDVLHAGGVL